MGAIKALNTQTRSWRETGQREIKVDKVLFEETLKSTVKVAEWIFDSPEISEAWSDYIAAAVESDNIFKPWKKTVIGKYFADDVIQKMKENIMERIITKMIPIVSRKIDTLPKKDFLRYACGKDPKFRRTIISAFFLCFGAVIDLEVKHPEAAKSLRTGYNVIAKEIHSLLQRTDPRGYESLCEDYKNFVKTRRGKKTRLRKTEGKLDKMKRDLGIASPEPETRGKRVKSSPEVEAAKKRLRARFKSSRVKTEIPRAKVEIPNLLKVKLPPKSPIK